MNKKDITGQRFGRLIVLKETGERSKEGRVKWLCQCDCGNKLNVVGKSLRNGNTKSCGCLQKERVREVNTIHGKRKTRLYSIWHDMLRRCENPKVVSYKLYGYRGIKICEKWHDFQSFYDWAMENGYADSLTLDRIDCDGNYEPKNCRWVSMKTQQNNRRNNHIIEYNGETHTLSEWENIVGIRQKTLWKRINTSHWSIEKALTTPTKKRGNK